MALNHKVIRQSCYHSGVNDTAVADTADSAMQTWFKSTKTQRCARGEALAAFKISIKINYIGKLYYPIAITITQ
jgi:hypothetical protein